MSSVDQHPYQYSTVLAVQADSLPPGRLAGDDAAGPHPHIHGFHAHHRSLLLFIFTLCTIYPVYSVLLINSDLDNNGYETPAVVNGNNALWLAIEFVGVLAATFLVRRGQQPPRYYFWVYITFFFATIYIITSTFFVAGFIVNKILFIISLPLLGFTATLSQVFLAWGTRVDYSGFWFGMMGAAVQLRILGIAPLLTSFGGSRSFVLRILFVVFIVILKLIVLVVSRRQIDLQDALRRLYEHHHHIEHQHHQVPSSSFKSLCLVYFIALLQSYSISRETYMEYGGSYFSQISLILWPIFLPILINASLMPRWIKAHSWKRVGNVGLFLIFISVIVNSFPSVIYYGNVTSLVSLIVGVPFAIIGGALSYSSLLAMLRNLNPGKQLITSYFLFFFVVHLGSFFGRWIISDYAPWFFGWEFSLLLPGGLVVLCGFLLRIVGEEANGPKF